MNITLKNVKERALTILGALVVIVCLILLVGGMLYVGKKIVDALNKLFPQDTELRYYYEGYQEGYFHIPDDATIPLQGEPAAYREEPTEWSTLYSIQWSEFVGPDADWIECSQLECLPSQIQQVLWEVTKWDVKTANEARDRSRPDAVHVPQSGFYRAVVLRD